jgi:hypothetical protein
MDCARYQTVTLQVAQCLGEHALRDIEDGTAQLTKAMGALGQSQDEERAPLVAYPIEHVTDRAVAR